MRILFLSEHTRCDLVLEHTEPWKTLSTGLAGSVAGDRVRVLIRLVKWFVVIETKIRWRWRNFNAALSKEQYRLRSSCLNLENKSLLLVSLVKRSLLIPPSLPIDIVVVNEHHFGNEVISFGVLGWYWTLIKKDHLHRASTYFNSPSSQR